MPPTVDYILARRAAIQAGRRWTALLPSLVLHGAVVAVALLAPSLAAREHEAPRYVAVQLMPLQALGTPEPGVAGGAPRSEAAPLPPTRREEPPEPAAMEAEVDVEPAPTAPPGSTMRRDEAAEPPAARPQPPPPAAPGGGAEDAGAAAGEPGRWGAAVGSPQGVSPFGTAVAGLDNPDFVYGYYIEQMLAMIGSRWVRPRTDEPLEATIHFRIGTDGTLSEIRLVSSSGYEPFDLAALRAVQSANPLPRLPRSYRHDSLGVNLIFR